MLILVINIAFLSNISPEFLINALLHVPLTLE
jgi:hypothetical protein